MSRSKEVLRMVVPSATVFFSSGCIMILELVASRLVARDLGSSLYTWTSIIGIVLTGIAVGNYLGGRIADRHHPRRALAVLFGLASGACVGIVVMNNFVGTWMWLWRLSWPVHVFIHVLLVFFLPSMLLGTIAPVVAKMALDRGLPTGRTIGDIYAWGAAGSIAGTFLAGFYLISTYGSMTIIWGIGAALLAMAVLYWLSCWVLYVWGMIFGALLLMGMAPADWAQETGTAAFLRQPADPNIVYEDETPYCHVAVRQTSQRPDRRAFMQDKLMHSEAIMGDVTNLQYFYTRIFAGLTHGLSKGRQDLSMMVIGGGGYAFPQYLKATWPNSRVDVVEIDPGVTAAATAAFGLDANTAIRTINLDARNYVDQLLRTSRDKEPAVRYDFIYEDAINDYSVPFQLVTREFNEKIVRLLTDDGAYMINLIDTYDNGRFLGAIVGTARQTFRHVYVLTSEIGLPSLRDTFVVVAAKRPLDPGAILGAYNKHLKFWLLSESEVERLEERAGRILLTDDYAPVEHMLAPVVRQSSAEILARRSLREAIDLQAGHQYEAGIRKYREAVGLNPSMALNAYNEIGLMYVAQKRYEEAITAFEKAIEVREQSGGKQTDVASVHMNLALLLDRMKKPKEAKEHFAKAAEWFRIELDENPGFVVAWSWLGDMEAMMGEFKKASDAFEKAVALEPSNPDHYEKLTRALAHQKRYEEAIVVARKHVKLMQERGQRELATELSQYVEFLEYQRAKQPR
jgi:tetratricopeptide (TPR) repeat protein/predicted membrane-bound spermidine synthase